MLHTATKTPYRLCVGTVVGRKLIMVVHDREKVVTKIKELGKHKQGK